MRVNDVERWTKTAQETPGWDERNALIASFVPFGAAVVDLGAGNRTLSGYLPEDATYQAVDLVEGEGVIPWDVNAATVPQFPRRYDVAVCSGLLEYIVDVERFLTVLPEVASSALFTYAAVSPGQSRSARAAMGWANHYTRVELIGLLDRADIPWTILREWRAQVLFAVYLDSGPSPLFRQREPVAVDAAWEAGFAALVSRDAGAAAEADLDVDAWVAEQREARKDKVLERSRIRRLESLPTWRWEASSEHWEARLVELKLRKPDEVPPEGLAAWADKQRAARARGELDVRRAAALAAVPGWLWDADQAAWVEGLRAMRSFVDDKGHSAVPPSFVHHGVDLGRWVGNLRDRFAAGDLALERERTLAELPGWAWNAADASWERGMLVLEAYFAREGHASVPLGYSESALDLGRWLKRQRLAYHAGDMSDPRMRRFAECGGLDIDPVELEWQTALEALRRQAKESGHASPAPSAGEDPVGDWMRRQRERYAQRSLSPRHIAALEALVGFAWDETQADWERNFAALQRYARRTGHAAPVRDEFADMQPIGTWVARQRSAHARGRLARALARRLEALTGWVWTAADGRFERRFAELAAHTEEHGFAGVGDGQPELAKFVAHQQRRHRKGELQAVQALRLDGLRGWTWSEVPAWAFPGLRALRAFTRREGHADVPPSHVEGAFDLGVWLQRQAEDHVAGELSPPVARLLGEHFAWAREPAGWDTSYRSLVERADASANRNGGGTASTDPPNRG